MLEDYFVGKLNITKLHNKLTNQFNREIEDLVKNLNPKTSRSRKNYNKLRYYIKRKNPFFHWKRVRQILSLLEQVKLKDLELFFRFLSATTPYKVRKYYENQYEIESFRKKRGISSEDVSKISVEATINYIIEKAKSDNVEEYFNQIVLEDLITFSADWRPLERIPEDYYAL